MKLGEGIPLYDDNYLNDLVRRVKQATDNFEHDAEILIPPEEAMEFDLESKVPDLVFKVGVPIACNWNDDGSATLFVIIS